MKYKIGDAFLIPVEITKINEKDDLAPYFINGCAGMGWWSEAALKDMEKKSCNGCQWKKEERYQKCTCCIRNRNMKDCYKL